MLAAFAEIAEIERETIVARVRSGLEAAKARGVKLDAPQKLNEELYEKAKTLREQGLSYKKIANELSLSVGSVHGTLKTSSELFK